MGLPAEAPDRLFRDRKKAITRFQTQEFDVNAFVNSSYKVCRTTVDTAKP
jgi:hypothetical protein